MRFCTAITFRYVVNNFNKYRVSAETNGHHHGCSCVNEEDMEFDSKDNNKVIKKPDMEKSLGEQPLSVMRVLCACI